MAASHPAFIEIMERRALFDAGAIDPAFGESGSIAGGDRIVQFHDGRIVTVVASGNAVKLRHYSRQGLAQAASDLTLSPTSKYSDATMLNGLAGVDAQDRLFVSVAGGVVCVLPNGAIDRTFGVNGAIAAPLDHVYDFTVQHDGKLVFAGNFSVEKLDEFDVPHQSQVGALVRLTSRGRRDMTLGPKGIQLLGDFSGVLGDVNATAQADRVLEDSRHRLLVQQSGRVDDSFSSGGTFDSITETTTFSRRSADGAFDDTFTHADDVTSFTVAFTSSVDGTSEPDPPFGRDVSNAALDARDRLLLVVGPDLSPHEDGTQRKTGILRLTSNGASDTTFSGDGFADAFLDADTREVFITDVAADDVGRVLVSLAATNAATSNSDRYLVRLRSDGAVDATFGDHGAALLRSDSSTATEAIIVAKDGDVLVSRRNANHRTTSYVSRYFASDAPTVDADFRHIRLSTARSQNIDLTIRHDGIVDLATLGRALRITGPHGFAAYARFDHIISNTTSGGTIVARYKLAAPAGSWDAAGNGEYVVQLINRAIGDVTDNKTDGRLLGSFFVKA